MVDGRVVAQLEFVVAFDAVLLADGGEQFGLFDGVDAEVGFEVEVEVEHVGRVAGLLGDEREHVRGHAVGSRPRLDSGAGRGAGSARRPGAVVPGAGSRLGPGGLGRGLGRGAVVDEGDDVVEGGVVAQLERVVAFDVVGLADGGEHLGLLDGVDAEVGFEVEVEVEQVGRVAGLLGHEREHARGHAVGSRRPRPGAGSRRGAGGVGAGRARPARARARARPGSGAGRSLPARARLPARAAVAPAGLQRRGRSGSQSTGTWVSEGVGCGGAAAVAPGPWSATRSRCPTTSSRGSS